MVKKVTNYTIPANFKRQTDLHKVDSKYLINIGATLDVPTSKLVIGNRGETIIAGGLPNFSAIVGPANNFKSTIYKYMMLSAMNKILATNFTYFHENDTEGNIDQETMQRFADIFENIIENPITVPVGKDKDGEDIHLWSVSDRVDTGAEKFAETLDLFFKSMSKQKKVEYTAFKNIWGTDKGNPYMNYVPYFFGIDSLTYLKINTNMEAMAGIIMGDDDNMIAMRNGKYKDVLVEWLNINLLKYNSYCMLTAAYGENKDLKGKYEARPTRRLGHMGAADKLVGVPQSFDRLTKSAWAAAPAVPLTDNNGVPIYGDVGRSVEKNELNVVKLKQLRGKFGGSGITVSIVVSQTKGVEPFLTEFYNIHKLYNMFGLYGNNTNYRLHLRPDVALNRDKVVKALNNDELFKRAVNITSELCQFKHFKPGVVADIWCEPDVLYEDLIKMGYKWDQLLDTRGWWAIDQYNKNLKPFLSSIDLLKMRAGLYKPYWL